MKKVEQKITEGLVQPRSLIESCEVLGMCKVRIAGFPLLNNLSFPLPQTFQDECEAKLAVLEEAAASAQKMTYHQDADDQVGRFQVRWGCVHETAKEWVARMTTLVECWNKLDGNVGELSSWVNKQVTTIIKINSAVAGTALIIVIMFCAGLHGCGRKGRLVN